MANRLELLITGDASGAINSLSQVRRESAQAVADIKAGAQEAALSLGALSAGGTLLTRSFLESASQMQQFEATLKSLSGSSEKAKSQLQQMVTFASKTPFDLPGVVEAGVKITALGVSVDRFLPLAGNMAAAMNKSIPDAAQALAKAASGSHAAILALSDTFGITKRELLSAGAALGQAGAIAANSGNDIAKLQNALEKVISTRFGKAMEEQSKTLKGAFSNLTDSLGQLKASLGEKLAPTFDSIAKSLTKMIDSFRALPGSTQEMIAQSVFLATAVAGIGAAVVGVVAVAGPLSAALATLTASVGTFSGGAAAAASAVAGVATAMGPAIAEVGAATAAYGAFGGAAFGLSSGLAAVVGAIGGFPAILGGVVAAIALATDNIKTGLGVAALALTPLLGFPAALAAVSVALVGYTASINANTAEQEAQLKVGVRVIQSFHDQKVAIGATADALRELGKTDLDITKVMNGYAEFAKAAREAGNKDLADRFDSEVDRLRTIRNQFRGTETAKQDAIKATSDATKDAASKAVAAADEFKKKRSDGFYATKAMEQQALQSTLAGLESQAEAISKIDEKTAQDIKTRIKSLKDESTKLDRESRKETADNALKEIENQAALGKISKKDEAEALRELADRYQDVTNFKRDTAFKAAQAEKTYAEETLQAEAKVLEAQKAGIDQRITGLEASLKKGGKLKDQQAEITAAIREREKAEEAILAKQLAADIIKEPAQRVQLEAAAAEKIKTIHAETAQAINRLADEVRAHQVARIHATVTTAEAAAKGSSAEIEALKERLKAGEQVDDLLVKEIKHHQELEAAVIKRKKAETALATTDAQERKDKLKALDDELAASQKKSAKEQAQVEREADTRKKKDKAEDAALDEKLAQARVDGLKAEGALGQRLDGQYLQAIKERQAAQDEAARAKAKADESGKNPAEIARIEKQLKYDLLVLTKQHKEEEEKVKAEIEAQNNLLKAQHDEMNGKVQTLQEAFSGPGAFSLDSPKGGNRFADSEKLDKQKAINAQYEAGLKDLKKGDKSQDLLGPTERREMNERMMSESSKAKDESPDIVGAIQDLKAAIIEALAKPATVEMRGSRPATEDTPWHQRLNRS